MFLLLIGPCVWQYMHLLILIPTSKKHTSWMPNICKYDNVEIKLRVVDGIIRFLILYL